MLILLTGVPIDKVALLDQETRDYVGRKMLELTLKELFVFRFMQTDPNWGNFLYDEPARTINLIDFGAARDYPKKFVDDYLRMVTNLIFTSESCENSLYQGFKKMSRPQISYSQNNYYFLNLIYATQISLNHFKLVKN